MGSDENTKPKAEWFPINADKGVRLLAYSYAISGKESTSSSKEDKAENGTGITGLMKELEKTKLDV